MAEQLKKLISVQNDSFYNILAEILKKDRVNSFDAYQIKVYLMKDDLLKTTSVEKRVMEYVYNNLKDWHTLVKNINASKIFLMLNEQAKNNFNIEKVLKIARPTVRYWVGHLLKLNLIVLNDFNYGVERLWKRNDLFEQKSDPGELVQEGGMPKDKLKLKILNLTAYFCLCMLERKTLDKAKKEIKREFSFMKNPIKKENFLK